MGRTSLAAEVDAARTVAAKNGLGAVEPKVLRLAKHTTVRLAPHPIVARIRSGATPKDMNESLARELAIARHLAAHAAPTVRAAAKVDAGPHLHDDCAVTLWEFVAGRTAKTEADALAAARALQRVHQALAHVGADLPSFTVAIDSVEAILRNPTEAPKLPSSDRLFLERLYAKLRQELDGIDLKSRPLHGDAHLANVLITGSGAVWMDLEAVCTGPLEWDVVTLPASVRPEFKDIDPDLTRLLADLRSLCVAVWCWADFERSSDISEAATYHLDRLKGRFGL